MKTKTKKPKRVRAVGADYYFDEREGNWVRERCFTFRKADAPALIEQLARDATAYTYTKPKAKHTLVGQLAYALARAGIKP